MNLPWRRNDRQNGTIPPEVKQYYEASRKERKSIAWLLAFATLAATVVIAFGAFFAGRWVYRKIAGNDEPTTTVNVPNDQTDEKPAEPKPAENKPTQPKKTTKKPKPQSTRTQTTSRDSGKSPDLANTGPGDTLAVFILATVLGAGIYQYKLRKSLN